MKVICLVALMLRVTFAAALGVVIATSPLIAEETIVVKGQGDTASEQPVAAAPEDDSSDVIDRATVRELVGDLSDDHFAVREAATRRLQVAGAAAIPTLIAAAQSNELEVALRAFRIFSANLIEGSPDARKATIDALRKLVDTGDEATAGRANELIERYENRESKSPALAGPPADADRLLRNLRQGVFRQVQMVVNNGHKKIKVVEDNRKIGIVVDPQNGIKIEVTEEIDGEEATKIYQAQNEAELKKNHPIGHAIYEQYAGGQGPGIQLQIQRFQREPFWILPERFDAPDPKSQVKRLQRDIEDLRRRIEELKAAELKAARENLQEEPR